MRWFSVKRLLTHCGMFGIGFGWDGSDGTFCVLVQCWKTTIIFGPHVVALQEE